MMATRRFGLCALVTCVALVASVCSGSKAAVSRRAGTPSASNVPGSPMSFAAAKPSRLNKAVTLYNGKLRLAPALPGDRTSVTYARAVALLRAATGRNSSFTKTGAPARPIVVLARYTDNIAASQASAGAEAHGVANDPNARLVVAVLFYGPPAMCCCCVTGGTGPPSTGPSTYESNLWLLDPNTGRLGDSASFPGPLPRISTTPQNG
jgi:hypothetical protein